MDPKTVQIISDGGTAVVQKGGRKSEAARSRDLIKTLPKGVRIGMYRDGRSAPYFVRFGSPRKVKTFALEVDRNDFAETQADALANHGKSILAYDAKALIEWQEFRARCPAPLFELEALWHKHSGSRVAMSTTEAVKKYVALRLAEDIREGSDTYRHLDLHLRRFCAEYGAAVLDDVTADAIRLWLSRLIHPSKKTPMKPITVRHHRKDVNTFFKRAVREGWIDKNPCEIVVPPKLGTADPIHFLSVEQAFRFFKVNINRRGIWKLALEAFAGMRCSAAAQLVWGDIDFIERGISIPAGRKSEQRNYVDGFPDNLWAWLELARADKEAWNTNQSTYDFHKRFAFDKAEVKNDGNSLRHSFCTYHVAAFKDVAKTATLLCHRAPAMLYRHYKGRGASQATALGYFAITPITVAMSWEEFAAFVKDPREA